MKPETTEAIASLSGPLERDYGAGMAGETREEAGPSVEWLMAQPYEMWGDVRRSERPVLATEADAMGPGTFYQVTRYKDAESVLRDDKTFASSINAQHI